MINKRQLIQAITFEIVALSLFVVIFSPLFDKSIVELGTLGIVLSLLTVVVLYFYNQLFDHLLLKYTGKTEKSKRARVIHALMFESSLIILTLPALAWWLKISLLDALILEAAAVSFMVVYTFIFHWSVDYLLSKKSVTCKQDVL